MRKQAIVSSKKLLEVLCALEKIDQNDKIWVLSRLRTMQGSADSESGRVSALGSGCG